MRLAVVAATALLLQRAGIAADVSGTLTGDLSLPAGQHRLTGNLTIEATGSLTLQPGAELRATGSFVISVYGTLRASGTSAQPCLIAAAAARPGSWQGIVAFSGATLSLTYTTVAGAGTNVTANGCNLALNGCVIRDCARDGVAVYGPSSVNISECSFVSCGRRGLFLET
ncbi:MAG: hypothetical protein H5T86_15825, partial [Armatimonadetes bacterium]|nr:hypothetical protein [Armatimonadota bacterium]